MAYAEGEKGLKIISVGNSFAQDAQAYLHTLAASAGVELHSENLMIGGCSLERHAGCLKNNLDDYVLEVNGVSTEKHITLREALTKEKWDVVTLQQASHYSFDYGTYMPYLQELSDGVRALCPGAEQVIHQTWAYEDGSERLTVELGFSTSQEMYDELEDAYNKAAHQLGGARQIPSGLAFRLAQEAGFGPLHRDTFHAQIPQGRYLLSAVWFTFFTGKNAAEASFLPEGMTQQEKELLDRIAYEAVERKKAEK